MKGLAPGDAVRVRVTSWPRGEIVRALDSGRWLVRMPNGEEIAAPEADVSPEPSAMARMTNESQIPVEKHAELTHVMPGAEYRLET